MKLRYTGERVIPNEMKKDVINWILHLQRYIFALKYVVDKKVLDAACGTGYGMAILSSVAESVEGVDNHKLTLTWAKKNNYFYCPVSFKNIDLEKENLVGNFDCVVSFETVEHLANPEFFIKNVKKILNPGGVLVFSTPVGEPPNPFHKRQFSWATVKSFIEENFGTNNLWFSQNLEGIKSGEDKKALFAIGIAYRDPPPPILRRLKLKGKSLGHQWKRKIKEILGIIPKSRW